MSVRTNTERRKSEDSRLAGVMDYQFNADWKRLSSIERAHRCRLLATEALTMAETAAPALKERHLAVADELLRLALDLEAKGKISHG